MERIDLQCDAKSIWETAKDIIFQTLQCYESELCVSKEDFDTIMEWNKNRIKPLKFTSRVGFRKKEIKGLIVFITYTKNRWQTIPTEKDKATLVIYIPKVINFVRELRKYVYRLKSDEERNI